MIALALVKLVVAVMMTQVMMEQGVRTKVAHLLLQIVECFHLSAEVNVTCRVH